MHPRIRNILKLTHFVILTYEYLRENFVFKYPHKINGKCNIFCIPTFSVV